MADTVHSLIPRLHELLVTHLTQEATGANRARDAFSSLAHAFLGAPQPVDVAAGLHDLVARATALGPDAAWLAAAGHASLAGMALTRGEAERTLYHLDAAVTFGYNDCVAFHAGPLRPLHHDPRLRFVYERMRVTAADLDELYWLHREMHVMVREAQDATVDNIGRSDTGVSSLPAAPLPTREPDSPGVLATRIELAAVQTALQQSALKAEFQRSSGNTSLDLIDGGWDYGRARRDAWHADELDARRERDAAARAFVERPGAGRVLGPCPPLGSVVYPA
ncbi:hypothetical protein GCM10010302_66080 [Streptomyces polychromogenes]|uniref:Uncharacterized protein n=1 Tax=Streptomyces polychromogenes TaxID=67342 RepID=A0ABN0VUN9_9ACTN